MTIISLRMKLAWNYLFLHKQWTMKNKKYYYNIRPFAINVTLNLSNNKNRQMHDWKQWPFFLYFIALFIATKKHGQSREKVLDKKVKKYREKNRGLSLRFSIARWKKTFNGMQTSEQWKNDLFLTFPMFSISHSYCS